jgi:hypothetical protein
MLAHWPAVSNLRLAWARQPAAPLDPMTMMTTIADIEKALAEP